MTVALGINVKENTAYPISAPEPVKKEDSDENFFSELFEKCPDGFCTGNYEETEFSYCN